jgi:hypothetical protein
LTALGLGLSHERPIRFNGVLEVALKLLNPLILLNHLIIRFLGELGEVFLRPSFKV